VITTILSDFSRVILLPKDKNYKGTLNGLYKELIERGSPFNFFDYFEFNDEILNLYSMLKKKYSINIFTSGTIQNTKEVKEKLGNSFDNVFTAADYQLNKEDPSAYEFIVKKLGVNPDQILYIDDEIRDIEAANKARLNTIHYEEFQKLLGKIKKALNKDY